MYNLEISELRGKLLQGSSYGWVLMVDGSQELNLINPLTRAQIQLPLIWRLSWDKFTHPVLFSFYETVSFEVYKFDQRDLKWKEVENIGDNVDMQAVEAPRWDQGAPRDTLTWKEKK